MALLWREPAPDIGIRMDVKSYRVRACSKSRAMVLALSASLGAIGALMPTTAAQQTRTEAQERAGLLELQRDAVDRSEAVSLHQSPLRVVRQVGDGPIRQAREVRRIVDAGELDGIQDVEHVEPDFELRPMHDREILRH